MYIYIYTRVHLTWVSLPIGLPTYLSTHLPTYNLITYYLPTYLPAYLSNYQSVYQSIRPVFLPSIHPTYLPDTLHSESANENNKLQLRHTISLTIFPVHYSRLSLTFDGMKPDMLTATASCDTP